MSSFIEGYNYDIFISYRQKKKERETRSLAMRGDEVPRSLDEAGIIDIEIYWQDTQQPAKFQVIETGMKKLIHRMKS